MMSATGRNMNGKSKALKGSTQDYTNLLCSDSESDGRVPDLKLPPLKGKKQKRKRNLGIRPDDTSWGVGSVFKVLLTITILAGMLALAAITFWSLKKMTEMEDQIGKLPILPFGVWVQMPEMIFLQDALSWHFKKIQA